MAPRLPSRGKLNQRVKDFIAEESGAIALIMAAALVALLGMGALAIDYGYMASTQSDLKKAAEAGALAGAAALGNSKDWSAAATSILQKNGYLSSDFEVNKGSWSLVQQKYFTTAPSGENPSPVDAIQVVVAKSLELSFAPILGIKSKALTGTSVAVPKGGAPYTLFVGDPVKYPTSDLTLSAWLTKVTGSVFSNDNVKVSGLGVTITGTAAAVHDVNASGWGVKIGTIKENATALPMPDYSSNIKSLNPEIYSGDQTFSANNMSIANSIYVQAKSGTGGRHGTPAQAGDVTINGIGISTTGAILADGDITITSAGFTMNGANQMALYSLNGDITINAFIFNDTSSSAIIYAPNGTVTVKAIGAAFQGSIIAGKGITINGLGMSFQGGYGIKAIPGAGSAFGGGGQGASLVQ
ncbi:MAG: TadG family pilus assembly protein [Desulfobaccales bacterium]